MRSLIAFVLLSFTLSAVAASSTYDIYVLACDGSTDCLRVADMDIDRVGPSSEFSGPGINLRIDTLAANADAATVRLTLSLTPRLMAFAAMGTHQEAAASQFTFQIEPCTLKQGQFGFLGTFSGGTKVYQVWGRMVAQEPTAKVVASR